MTGALPQFPTPGAASAKRPPTRIPPGIFALPFGVLMLIAGLWGGLARLGFSLPAATMSATLHGLLMSLGFLGTLISTERAVALARVWAWGVPTFSVAGSALLLFGGPAVIGYGLLAAAGLLFVLVYIRLDRIQRSTHNTLMGFAAAGWAIAAVLALTGASIRATAPWLAIFLVVTITAERLELSRMLKRSKLVRTALVVAIALMGIGAVIATFPVVLYPPEPGVAALDSVPVTLRDWGIRLTGFAMAAIALWLGIYDLARRTIRARVVTRFMAAGLLAGYVWLFGGGVLWAVTGYVSADGYLHDAQLHTIFLGFVMSMVFAHAPVIAPAIIRKPLPYFPIFYGPLALLHVSLVLRVVVGDAAGWELARQWGGILGEISILAFVAVTVGAFVKQAADDRRRFAAPVRHPGGTMSEHDPSAGPVSAGPVSADPVSTDSTSAAHGSSRVKVISTVAGAILGVVILVAAIIVANSGTPSTPAETAAGDYLAGPVTDAATATAGVEVSLTEMKIEPAVIVVEPGTPLRLNVTNNGTMTHDVVFANGVGTPLLSPGETFLLDLGPLDGTVEGWCTLPGHRQMGMTMTVGVADPNPGADDAAGAGDGATAGMPGMDHGGAGADAAVSANLADAPPAGWNPIDATLDPAPNGTVHEVTWHITDVQLAVAPDVTQTLWTFDGRVPGPTLRGKVGDTFEVTLINDTDMDHNIDFHVMEGPPSEMMTPVAPGESHTYTFVANHAGAWLYHCGVEPMLMHMGNGMYGALIIDPPDLSPVEKEFVLVGSELFFGPEGDVGDYDKMLADAPDAVVFNGYPFAYHHAPLTAKVGEKVRIWVVDAGPTRPIAFHVIGAPFTTQYLNGAYLLRDGVSAGGTSGAAQTLPVDPGNGGFVELTFAAPGDYPFVNHAMVNATIGSMGIFTVTE